MTTPQPPSAPSSPWGDVSAEEVRLALRGASAAGLTRLRAAFRTSDEGHRRVLLALTPDERRHLLATYPSGAELFRDGLVALAFKWAHHPSTVSDALVLYDDLLAVGGLRETAYNNALWAVIRDNNKLPPMPERARRYLAAALPHAPQNRCIHLNAACVYFDLGERDAMLEQVRELAELAPHHTADGQEACGYLEVLRDEPLLAAMYENDEEYAQLLSVIDPPEFADLARAREQPAKVRRLELRDQPVFPDLSLFPNLEVLSFTGRTEAPISTELAKMPRLRKLESSTDVPDEVVIMPSLRELRVYTAVAHKRFPEEPVGRLLRAWARDDTPPATRLVELALLRKEDAVAGATLEGLVAALDSTLPRVRARALRLLENHLEGKDVQLVSGGNVVVVGALNMDREVLAARLARHGVTLARAGNAATCAVVIGDEPKGKASAYVGREIPIALEVQLRRWLDDAETPHLIEAAPRDTEITPRLSELLLSDDGASVTLALTMMKTGGVPNGVLEELFLVFQDPQRDAKTRDDARKLFAQYAPRAVQDAAAKAFPSARSLRGTIEKTVRARLKMLAKHAPGGMDVVKLATLLLPERGYSYLLEVGQKDEAVSRRTLKAMVRDGKLDLSGAEMGRAPRALSTFPERATVTSLSLAENRLKELPPLDLPNLETFNLSANNLGALPESLASLPRLRELDLQRNEFPAFPTIVCRLRALRRLDLSIWGIEYQRRLRFPLTELPADIGNLVELEELALRGHDLQTLPEALLRLPNLRVLDLSYGQLGALPDWVGNLCALQELHIARLAVADETSVAPVVLSLRARGVAVLD